MEGDSKDTPVVVGFSPHAARRTHTTLAQCARAVLRNSSSASIAKYHFGLTEEWHAQLKPELSFASSTRQIFRDTFLDTPDSALARSNHWLRMRELQGPPRARHREWSLKTNETKGAYRELRDEHDILRYLRDKNLVPKERIDMVTLRQAFPTNLAQFDTDRITLYMNISDQPRYLIYVDLTSFFGGEYYLVGTLKFEAEGSRKLGKQLPKSAVRGPVPSKIIEYIRRFHSGLYRDLCTANIVPKLPYKNSESMTRFDRPPLFWPAKPTSIPPLDPAAVNEFQRKYLDDKGCVPQKTATELLAIEAVVGFAVGAQPEGLGPCIAVFVNRDPARMRQDHPLLAEKQFHLIEVPKSHLAKPFVLQRGNSGTCLYSEKGDHSEWTPNLEDPDRTRGSICFVGQREGRHYALTAWHFVDGCDSELTPQTYSRACTRAESAEFSENLKAKVFFTEGTKGKLERFGKVWKGAFDKQVDAAALEVFETAFLRCRDSPPAKLQQGVLPQVGEEVSFIGSTSGITSSPLRYRGYKFNEPNHPPLDNTLLFKRATQPGDSGGLWFVTRKERRVPIGLHRGEVELGGVVFSVANTIDDALDRLDLAQISVCHSGNCECGATEGEDGGESESESAGAGEDEEPDEETEDEDEETEDELRAKWQQALANMRLRDKETHIATLVEGGLSPSYVNGLAEEKKHPLLISMGFLKAAIRMQLIEAASNWATTNAPP